MNKLFLILLFVLSVSACSTKKDIVIFTPAVVEAEQAAVYIYRSNKMTNAMYSPGITINGELKLYAKSGVNTRLLLTPGKHLFDFQAETTYSELTPLTLELSAGDIHYIRIDTSLKVQTETNYQPYERNFKLIQITQQQALKEISQCCINNREISSDKPPPIKKEKNSGFSVDKTQNPFSH